MKATEKMAAYVLLAAGGALFCWPIAWMLGTSLMADRELFSGELSILPQRPVPRLSSPYVDDRPFKGLEGPRMEELLRRVQSALEGMPGLLPEDLDRQATLSQVSRGLCARLKNLLPAAAWNLPPQELAAEALKRITPSMARDMLKQLRRSLLIGQFRARSYGLQEDLLVPGKKAAGAWDLEGSAEAYLLDAPAEAQGGAELHYNFTSGSLLRLSQTFRTSFPVETLYRLQLSMRGDESWNSLAAYVEMKGKRYKAARSLPVADTNWTEITWQEPGPDDESNKIRSWTHLLPEDVEGAFESRPDAIKVILEFERRGWLGAWAAKAKRNYQLVFDNMPFWRYTLTSVLLVLMNLLGTLASCSMVAFSFARLRWPGRNLSFAVMLGTMMVPAQVTMIPFFLIIKWLDWYNSLYPLWVSSFFAGAFNVFLLHQFYKGIPTDLEDAAKIDGCGPLRIYWYIMLPLVKPALASIAIFTFMGVWNDFMGPLIYLSDQRLYPLSLGLYALNVQAGGSMSMMMAGSLLMILPVIAIFFLAQRYFIQGITMTGLKS